MLVRKINALRTVPLPSISIGFTAPLVAGFNTAVVSCVREDLNRVTPVAAIVAKQRVGLSVSSPAGTRRFPTAIFLDGNNEAGFPAHRIVTSQDAAKTSLIQCEANLNNKDHAAAVDDGSKCWFEVLPLLTSASATATATSAAAETQQPFILREVVSGAVFASSVAGTLFPALPRLGIATGMATLFPPPPFLTSAEVAKKLSIDPLVHLQRHFQSTQRVAIRIADAWDSATSSNKKKRSAAVSSHLVLVSDGVIINDGREAVRQLDTICAALVDAIRFVRQRGHAAGSVDERALWEHCFCRVVDMLLRECGSVATLVDVLVSREPNDNNPTAEAKFFLQLIDGFVRF